MVIGVRNSSW